MAVVVARVDLCTACVAVGFRPFCIFNSTFSTFFYIMFLFFRTKEGTPRKTPRLLGREKQTPKTRAFRNSYLLLFPILAQFHSRPRRPHKHAEQRFEIQTRLQFMSEDPRSSNYPSLVLQWAMQFNECVVLSFTTPQIASCSALLAVSNVLLLF